MGFSGAFDDEGGKASEFLVDKLRGEVWASELLFGETGVLGEPGDYVVRNEMVILDLAGDLAQKVFGNLELLWGGGASGNCWWF